MSQPDDQYTYPWSGGVLKNKHGIRDRDTVNRLMNRFASAHWASMQNEPLPTEITFEFLAGIHHRFFGELFDWAGQIRVTATQASGTGLLHAMPEYIESELPNAFAILNAHDGLRGLSDDEFVNQLAEGWGYLTQIHPFRDGNTRSQAAMVDRLAFRAGHPIAWSGIDVDTLRLLRHNAISRPPLLAEYLGEHLITPPSRPLDREAHRRAAVRWEPLTGPSTPGRSPYEGPSIGF